MANLLLKARSRIWFFQQNQIQKRGKWILAKKKNPTENKRLVPEDLRLREMPDDALAQPNIQRRACWINTLDCRADPTPHSPFNRFCVCSLYHFVPPKKPSKSMPWRRRCCAVAQASFDDPLWCGPHPAGLWPGLALRAHPHRNLFSP